MRERKLFMWFKFAYSILIQQQLYKRSLVSIEIVIAIWCWIWECYEITFRIPSSWDWDWDEPRALFLYMEWVSVCLCVYLIKLFVVVRRATLTQPHVISRSAFGGSNEFSVSFLHLHITRKYSAFFISLLSFFFFSEMSKILLCNERNEFLIQDNPISDEKTLPRNYFHH